MINFKIEKFEGPLSLLLRLIEKEELDVTQVSMAKVADQYVDYIQAKGNINPEEMVEFLVVASRLLLMKSKALLPYIYPEEEEEIEELELALKMYQEFIEASKEIQKIIGKRKFMFAREFNRKAILDNTNVFAPPKKLKKEEISGIFAELLERIRPVEEELEEKTIEEKVTIEEKILHVQNILLSRITISFNKILNKVGSKTEIVVSFLAILELMRQREVTLEQEEMFGEISINRIGDL
ncbi:MAG: segregation/condensation protein A [Patescibacteria group bacterium]|nr:segregation/condensation protein A [Patescibacteria group bacterium]